MCIKIFLVCLFSICLFAVCSAGQASKYSDKEKGVEFVGRMIEQGRTLVHHAVKRFMIILPAIFFKLGIGFTLLVLVTIVAINNGFIGFLLLVVGLSSVLARLQEARRPPAPAYITPTPYYHQAHLLDRSDSVAEKSTAADSTVQYSPSYQYYTNTRPYSGYSQAYYGQRLS